MYSEKEKQLFSKSRAVVDLHGFFIVSEEGFIVDNPKILVELLSSKELIAYDGFTEKSVNDKMELEDSVITSKIIQIINYPTISISLDFSPAGIISYIAEAIILKSQLYLQYPIEVYNSVAEEVTFIEEMSSIISYYTNTPYDTVIEWPISQIFKRYAVCQRAFPQQIKPLENSQEE